MEYQNFDCEIADGAARIRLIGPGAPQLSDLCDEFLDLSLRLQEDRAVRVILFTDGDHAFEFHHDLADLSQAHLQNEGLERLAADEDMGHKIVAMLADLPKPVVAATRGDIRNLGLGFYLAADIRLASPEATFTAADLAGGLLPGWGLTHILPRSIGPGRALEFLWSRRTLGAQEAHRIGLVDRLIPAQEWDQELDTLLDRLRSLPQPAVRLMKLAVQQSGTMDLTTMLSLEWEAQQQCWFSRETTEGLLAWQEGRRPELDLVEPDAED